MLDHRVVTAENLEEVRENIGALDQRDELEPGCETWGFLYTGGQWGTITIWPMHGRAAICFGGDSDWGDWDADACTITLEDGTVYDSGGEQVVDEDEEEDVEEAS